MHTNKQWVLETIAHRQSSAVPYNFMFSPPAREALAQHYGQTDLEALLNFPVRTCGCSSIKPLYANPANFGSTITDEFGVTWSTSTIDRGSPIGPALTEPDLSNYQMPNPGDAYRFQGMDEWCRENKDHFTAIWIGDLWERATFIRGMENILFDVALNTRFVEELLGALTDHILRTMQILFDRFTFDAVALSDDYGTQKALLISPTDWRRLIKPCLSRIFSFAKEHHRFIFLHSCGNIHSVIGDLIDVGLDILHPIQPEAMDVFQLKRQFGRDLTFCGGLNTQHLLPHGTTQQIRAEVKKLKSQMGRGGGYILEPGITIQADVPLENLLAMIEEARNN